MKQIEVRIVELQPMRVASIYGFGTKPEEAAWEKLEQWAKPKGYFEEPAKHRIFGFNNPDPAPGSPNYGYEFWIEVEAGVQEEGDVKNEEFAGGLYAVTRCRGVDAIGPTWQALATWRESSAYSYGTHQWLEEHIVTLGTEAPDLVLDLYLPLAPEQ